MKLPGLPYENIDCPKLRFKITGKWFNYGIVFIVLLLDMNMTKNQMLYEVEVHRQCLDPDKRICRPSVCRSEGNERAKEDCFSPRLQLLDRLYLLSSDELAPVELGMRCLLGPASGSESALGWCENDEPHRLQPSVVAR